MQRISLSDEITPGLTWREALRAERERTGVGPTALLRGRGDAPTGLSTGMIYGWLEGRTGTARKDHLDYVLDSWRGIDSEESRYVPLTHKRLDLLLSEAARTGVPRYLLLNSAPAVPRGLTRTILYSWFEGRVERAKKEHFEYVVARYASLPDGVPEIMDVPWFDRRETVPCEQQRSRRGGSWPGYVEITETYLMQLRAERKRTGLSPAALLRACRDKPPLLSSEMIGNWMSRTTRTASEELMTFVLETYRRAPDRKLKT